MIKTCKNCKIEYTYTENQPVYKKSYCNYVCEKADRHSWLYKLKTNHPFITNLIEKNLRAY